jgi:RND family efflux transporter MFP subunit
MSVLESQHTSTEVQHPSPDGVKRLLGIGILIACLVAGAFFAGRRSTAPPGPDGSAGVPAAHHAYDDPSHAADAVHDAHTGGATESGHETHDEHVITFTPEALAKAGIEVRAVAATQVHSQLQVTGVVEPDAAGVVKVTPRVAGKITSLRAGIGDHVRTGQILATMTSMELAEAQAHYRQAGARVLAAQANLRRQRQLAAFGEFGQHKVQDARGNFHAAQGDVNEALAAISAARNEVAEAQAALAATQSDEISAASDVEAAGTAVTQAYSQVKVNESRFNRQDTLLKEELTSRQDWEQAQAELRKAQSDVLAARAAAGSARAKVDAARARERQAQSVIATRQARLQQAEVKLAAAQQRLEIARNAQEREEKIYRSDVYANKEVAEAEATLGEAQIDRAAAGDAVRLLGGIPGGGNSVGVAAPLSGRVTERTVTAGETVMPERTLFTVVNLTSVWVQLNVYPRDLSAIRVGLPVTIATDAIPNRRFAGSVAYVGEVVVEASRTVRIRCEIANPLGLLKPDMFVRGSIGTTAGGRGIVVPRAAVQSHEGQSVVFVQGEHETEFEAREVEIDRTPDGQTLITAGLQPEDRIVTRGAFMVKAQAMRAELGHEH